MENVSLIQRPEYLRKLASFRDTDLIKIITGVRRSGKSTLLRLFAQELRQQGVSDAQLLFLNLEDLELESLRHARELHNHVLGHLAPSGTTYVFIDEVQLCADFADAINSLRLRPNIDLYVTGSNAKLLSSDLATYIAGRYVQIHMLPLSFREYVAATGMGSNLEGAYRQYVTASSFPYALNFQDSPDNLQVYLESLRDTLLLRDVMERSGFRDTTTVERVLRLTMDSIGNLLSVRKIADTLSSAGKQTNPRTVERYLKAFEESFLVYRAGRYDVRGRDLLRTHEKFYCVDPGLRRILAGPRSRDDGSMFENIVYLELLRRGYKVYVGRWKDREIDFVAMEPGGLQYYQVAATVRSPEVLTRELAPLQAIRDNYPKTILTLDQDPDEDIDGIRKVFALDWLMQADPT